MNWTARSLFDKVSQEPRPFWPGQLIEAKQSGCPDDIILEVRALLESVTESDSTADYSKVATIRASAERAVMLGSLDRIGSYRIDEVLGRGGFGVVYLAEQEHPVKRPVALKVLDPGRATPAALRRFEFEREALGSLQHPNIASLLDAGTTQWGQMFIVMELVCVQDAGTITPAEPITRYCELRALDRNRRLRIFREVCHAVQHAHGRGIIHRDLKPSNILVAEVEGTPVPKVIDFGIAKLVMSPGDNDSPTPTEVGTPLGSLAYMSPEQAEMGVLDIDTRTDVYSLGIVLYELLTGRRPHDLEGKTPIEAVRTIRAGAECSLGALHNTLRGDLATIVAKALETDRSRRYQAASELAEDIRRFMHNEPVVARPASTWYQVKKLVDRNRVLMGGVLAVIVALCLGLAGTAVGLNRARQAKALAESNAQDAQRAEKRASRLFDGGRTIARVFIEELPTKIHNLPGSTSARELLISAALPYLELLEAESGADTSLSLEIANGYVQISQVQWSANTSNRGEPARAMASIDKAVDLSTKLVESEPDSIKAKIVLSKALSSRSRVVGSLGNSEQQGRDLRRSLEVLSSITGADPKTAGTVDIETMNILMQLGDAARTTAEAEAYFTQASEKATAGLTSSPTSVVLLRMDAVLTSRLGSMKAQRRLWNDALELQLEALNAFERRLTEDPTDAIAQRDAAVSASKLCFVYRHMGRWDEATAAGQRSLDIRERLMQSDPFNTQAKVDVADALENMGQLHLSAGHPETTLEFAVRAEEMRRALMNAEPRNLRFRSNVVQSLLSLGDAYGNPTYENLRNPEGALESYQSAHSLMKEIMSVEPSEPFYSNQLGAVLQRLVTTHLALNNPDAALEYAQEQVVLGRRGCENDPDDIVCLNHYSISLEKLGDVLMRLNRTAEAIDSYRESLTQAEMVAQRSPGAVDSQQGLAEMCCILANVLTRTAKAKPIEDESAVPALEEAQSLYLRGSTIFSALAHDNKLPGGDLQKPELCERRLAECRDELKRRQQGNE